MAVNVRIEKAGRGREALLFEAIPRHHFSPINKKEQSIFQIQDIGIPTPKRSLTFW